MADINLDLLRRLADRHQHEALRHACEELLLTSDEAALWPLAALANAHLGDPQAAEAALQEAVELQEDLSFDALLDLAGAHIALLRPDAAEAILGPLLEKRPEHALALARMALCLLGRGELRAARRYFQRAGELDSSRVGVFTQLAALHLRLDDANGAEQAIGQGRRALASWQHLPETVTSEHEHRLETLQLDLWIKLGAFEELDHWLESRRATGAEEEIAAWTCTCADALVRQDRHAHAVDVLRDGLKRHPDNPALLQALADLMDLQGLVVQAMVLIQRAIRQDPSDPSLWVRLSSLCRNRFRHRALKAARKAVTLAEAPEVSGERAADQVGVQRAAAMNALAMAESQLQHYDRADALFREVLDAHPEFVPALRGLGLQQMQRGRIDEAIALFERVRAIDPAGGYNILMHARDFPDDAAVLAKLEAAARTPSLEGSVQTGMLFHLAAAWERRQDFDKAFALADEANAASRRLIAYDPREHRNRCARIRHAFCREFFAHRAGSGVDSTLPVFVVGMPRSGTTLVEQLLAGHSRVCGAGELDVIPRRIHGLNRWERRVGSGRQYPDCADDLTPAVIEGIAQGILEELREIDSDARHVIDKLPHNFEHIGFIKLLFPNARIISVRRDPRDIAISNYLTDYQARHAGMGFAYDLSSIGQQLADHHLLMRHWHDCFPGEIHEIRYEDIVGDLRGCARQLLSYLGLEWEETVVDFDTLERPVKTASVWQVRQPVYTTSRSRWKHYAKYLGPLIEGTNARIEWDPIDMITLPEPGLFNDGVELYHQGELDGAEHRFGKVLHHNPEHAAANFMVGLIWTRKGHLADGLPLMQRALDRCPWNELWRSDVERALQLDADHERAHGES